MILYRQRGSTLGLVAACVLVIILVGVAFFVISKILGGGKELQHAVDSGNLNIAKQALRKPGLALTDLSAIQKANFSRVFDANGTFDLLAYNRAVGQLVLVASNVKYDGGTGAANALTLYNELQGDTQNSLAAKLKAKLTDANNLKKFFEDVTDNNIVRMLWANNANYDPNTADVAYMARGKATNVYVVSGSTLQALPTGDVVTKNGKSFLSGYASLTGFPDGVTPVAVPLRPFEVPHLVSAKDFSSLKDVSTFPGVILPNAFKSGGSASESQSQSNIELASCAVVGSLDATYPASIPCGYLKFVNGSGSDFTSKVMTGVDLMSGVLMAPPNTGVYVDPFGTVFTKDKDAIPDIANFKSKNPGKPVPKTLTDRILGPSPIDVSKITSTTQTQCTNKNMPTNCTKLYSAMEQYFGAKKPGDGTTKLFASLMAVEVFKQGVIDIRASGATSVDYVLKNLCTGAKVWDPAKVGNNVPFGTSPATVLDLLNQANATALVTELKARILQISPNSDPDVALKNTIAMGETRYLWADSAGKLQWTTTPPPGVVEPAPDGTSLNFKRTTDLGETVINVSNDGGFPHPWDIPPGPPEGTGTDEVLFQRSSGFGCLLGVIYLRNCADGGGKWQGPC